MQAEPLQHRREAAGGAVAAAHRDGPRRHADKRVKPHAAGDTHGQKVLYNDKQCDESDHRHKRFPSPLQHAHIGLETYRSEEQHHAEILECPVEIKIHLEDGMHGKCEQRHQKSSGHRRRDAQALQYRYRPGKKHS